MAALSKFSDEASIFTNRKNIVLDPDGVDFRRLQGNATFSSNGFEFIYLVDHCAWWSLSEVFARRVDTLEIAPETLRFLRYSIDWQTERFGPMSAFHLANGVVELEDADRGSQSFRGVPIRATTFSGRRFLYLADLVASVGCPSSWEHAVAAVPPGHAVRRSLSGRRGRPAGSSFWIDASSVPAVVAAIPVQGQVGVSLIRFCEETTAYWLSSVRSPLDYVVVELIAHDGERLGIRIERDPEKCWVTIEQMAKVFGKDASLVTRALARAFADGRLIKAACCRPFASRRRDGRAQQVDHFDLSAISVVASILRSRRARAFMAFYMAASAPSAFRSVFGSRPAVFRLSDYCADK